MSDATAEEARNAEAKTIVEIWIEQTRSARVSFADPWRTLGNQRCRAYKVELRGVENIWPKIFNAVPFSRKDIRWRISDELNDRKCRCLFLDAVPP
ncbi:hypothetical protein HN011_010323, partial [Eciton burchellii]